jgi:uracil-DNA glycosylase
VSRPVDLLLDFLTAEAARGVSHVHLDEGARDGLRMLFEKSRVAPKPPIPSVNALAAAAAPISPPPPPLTLDATEGSSRAEKLAALQRQAETYAPARALGTLREIMVFATGSPTARVMFVGEAPGYQEEKERQPFVGPAGQKLNDILKAMGLSREEIYLTNIVKFRPATPNQTTNNRKPSPAEMAVCLPFVRQEIAIIQPQLIVALGGTAAEGLLGLTGTVTAMRNQWHDFEGTPLRVSYHPSYLLQSGGSNPIKRQLWEDMLAVMEKLALPISDKQRSFFLPKP